MTTGCVSTTALRTIPVARSNSPPAIYAPRLHQRTRSAAILIPVCFPTVDEKKPDMLDRITERLMDDAEADLDLESVLDPDNAPPLVLIGLAITILAVGVLGLLFLAS